MQMRFDTLANIAYTTAVEKGWYAGSEKVRPIGEVVALFHTEVAEATEELRKSDVDGTKIYYVDPNASPVIIYEQDLHNEPLASCTPPKLKPEGVAVELADLLIRLGDYCGSRGIGDAVQYGIDHYVWEKNAMTYPLEMMAILHGGIDVFYRAVKQPVLNQDGSERDVLYQAGQLVVDTRMICLFFGWDLDRAIELKLEYNKTRSFRHGGKKA